MSERHAPGQAPEAEGSTIRYEYPAELPISAAKETIVTAIKRSQVVIVSGQTGSGKTTQIPKMLLEMGRGTHGKQIVHTQPRRIAARSVAERLCQETGTQMGQEIGYQVRFTDNSSAHTRLRIVTDGILLAQIQHDPHLSRYDTVVIDEAHERSLNIDFLLGYLTELLPQRPDLKLIITSATIDSEKFKTHFEKALGSPVPVIEVSGRTYPVEILYEPAGSLEALTPVSGFADPDQVGADQALQVARAVAEFVRYSRHERGDKDILVFASGERDIRDFTTAIHTHLNPSDSIEILPLYARLSAKEQHRIFEHHGSQRIIIATNVAETSLTVPGVRYVVDPGTARISRYSKSAKVQRLPIEPISQASADQRAGRTGRVADGIAIRLYSQEDYESRPRFTDPEILRTSLGSVVLHMLSVGVARTAADVTSFGFVDPPDTRSVSDGITELTELGAIHTKHGQMTLTKIGRQLARLPIDERLGRMIIEAHHRFMPDILADILVITAFLSLQDPRERPRDKREEADRLHNRFADSTSDFLTILNLWDSLFQADGQPSSSALRRRCKAEYLNFLRIRQWQDLYRQLRQSCEGELHFTVGQPQPSSHADLIKRQLPLAQQGAHSLTASWDSDAIHRSMLAGLLSNIGMQVIRAPKASDFAGLKGAARARALKRAQKTSKNNYRGARGTTFAIFPASTIASSTPEWMMASELMETSRLWARMGAKIDPAWAEPLARNLTRTVYSEPHWSAAKGSAVANEKILLYGLPIISDRSVQWARIAPDQAREMLIRDGLVGGQITRRFPYDGFIARNRDVLEDSRDAANRTRGAITTVNDEDLAQFYDRVIPQSATSLAALGAWWKNEHDKNPHLLDFDPTSIDRIDDDAAPSLDDYPAVWQARGTDGSDIDLKLSYSYEPGKPTDGITVHIPLQFLTRLQPEQFSWLVPGFRADLVVGLIKALPKQLRVQFVPAPDTASRINEWIDSHLDSLTDGRIPGIDRLPAAPINFEDAFAQAAIAVKGVQLHPDVLDEERLSNLPDYLRVTFSVEETTGKNAQGAAKGHRGSHRGTLAPHVIATSKSLADLQQRLADRAQKAAQQSIGRHAKAAKDAGKAVASATILHQAGATQKARSTMLWDAACAQLKLPTARITSRWLYRESLALAQMGYPTTDALVDDIQRATVKKLIPDINAIATDDELNERCAALTDSYEDAVYKLAQSVIPIVEERSKLEKQISGTADLPLLATLQEIRTHLAQLTAPGFIGALPADELEELPRYIKADAIRLHKAKADKSRDVRWAWENKEAQDVLETARAAVEKAIAGPPKDEARRRLENAQWLYEEFRVSLWAQELGVKQHPSLKRLKKIIENR